MNYIYEAEGKTKQDAEKKALEVLGVSADQVSFKTVTSGKGFLGIVNKKPAVVRAYVKLDSVPVEVIVRGVVLTVIKKMGLDAEIEAIGELDGNIYISLHSDDSGILIGKQGRTLDALQFLVTLMIDSKYRQGKRIMIDVASYRERRQQRLSRLARAVADRVHKTRQSVLLESMNPYERRIVHLALEHDERVYTKSDGNGVYKRVRIIPMSERPEVAEGEAFEQDEY